MLFQRIHAIVAASDTEADAAEARRFGVHLFSLMMTKVADGLIDPKLVLTWLLNALGAPGYMIGALVPVREAGALLPQLGLARWIQSCRRRKGFWVGGSALQGLAALGIAAAAFLLEGALAGAAILACLALLATARASCSASYKDILARTVEKGARGSLSGAASGVAAAAVLGFAGLLSAGVIPLEPQAIALAIAVAGGLWLAAAALFASLGEPADDADTSDGRDLAAMFSPLIEDSELRTYVAVRALLISTALAPPFIVMLSGADEDNGLGDLGLMIVASSAASILSSYVWGALSDRSSRMTLAIAGGVATLALGGAALVGFLTGGLGGAYLPVAFIFIAQIAYEGVRAGRKVHLTDMDADGQRAIYTALSNTLIGLLLFLGAGFGVIADSFGAETTLAILAALSAVAAPLALRLSEVQQDA